MTASSFTRAADPGWEELLRRRGHALVPADPPAHQREDLGGVFPAWRVQPNSVSQIGISTPMV